MRVTATAARIRAAGAVVESIIQKKRAGDHAIRALMIESHLIGGQQELGGSPLRRGQSITDACLGFAETQP